MLKARSFKLFGLLLCIIIIYWLFNYYNLGYYLGIDGFNRYKNELLGFESHYVFLFTLSYIVLYIVLITCFVPGTIIFDLLAGFIYGPIVGSIIVVISYLLGAIGNFFLVRLFFHEFFHLKFCHLRSLILHESGEIGTFLNLLGLRVIPVIPFWVLNVLAAVLGVRFLFFLISTFLGIIPSSVIYVLIGHGVRGHLHENQTITYKILFDPHLWWPLCLLGILILIPNLIRLYKKHF